MKNIILMLALAFSANLFAQNQIQESATFNFNGSETLKEILLAKDVYRTEYRTEQQQTTCTRQVLDGYRRECHYETRQNCYYVPRQCQTVPRQICTSAPPVCRPVCHQGPQGQICRQVCSGGGQTCHTEYQQQCTGGYNQCTPYQYQVCNDVPVYRTETYACTQTVQVPYQVLDHHVDAKATINFAQLPAGTTANETFTVAIVNDDVVLTVPSSSKKVLIYAQKLQEVVVNGGVKVIGTIFNVDFINLEDVKASMTSINQVSIKDNMLTFGLGKAITNFYLKNYLMIEEKKIGRNPILINRLLTNFEVQPYVVNGQQMFSVDLKKLGLDLDGKYNVIIKAEAVLRDSRPLNHQDLPLLKLEKELEIKI